MAHLSDTRDRPIDRSTRFATPDNLADTRESFFGSMTPVNAEFDLFDCKGKGERCLQISSSVY